jgi:ubiquitin-conjugating enzyme E2 Z
MATFISKNTVNRLIKDVKDIIKNPLTDQGIYYIHDDTDMLKGYAMIVGPSDTPYFGGFYFFEFNYPTDYPHSPPKVKYCTNRSNIRFNPNLYTCGKVCVSLLNTWRGDQWTSCQSISTVLLTLCTLLCKDPLLNEPGVNKNNPDLKKYNKIIEYANIEIAVCDVVNKTRDVYMPFFEYFYPYVKENFNKNCDKLIEFAQQNINDSNVQNKQFTTRFYSMDILINYEHVLIKLNKLKEINKVLEEQK